MSGLLSLDRSQLLVVDVQERLVPAMAHFPEALRNIELLATAAIALGAPITISEQYPKGLGATAPQVREACGASAALFAKMHFSCARDPTLLAHLADQSRNQIVICGIETHVCVLQTAIDLKDRGLQPFVVFDATSSRRSESKDLARSRLLAESIPLLTAEMAVFEWLEKAGTAQFKTIAPLLR